jgi:hypothetical protein
MAKQQIKPNEGRDLANRAIAWPEGRLLLADGRELELTRWAPVLEAGAFIRVSIEAMVYIEKQPIPLDEDANGTT